MLKNLVMACIMMSCAFAENEIGDKELSQDTAVVQENIISEGDSSAVSKNEEGQAKEQELFNEDNTTAIEEGIKNSKEESNEILKVAENEEDSVVEEDKDKKESSC